MNAQSMAQLLPLDEAQQMDIQGTCEVNLTEVLDGLAGLVAVAEMPIGTRIYLMDGISHLRGHISAETNSMQATMKGRLN